MNDLTVRELGLIASSKMQTREFRQAPVLQQNEDGTPSGFENCGFHALKNALLAAAALDQPDLLNSKAFFQEFYQKYCQPHLQGRVGRRDATIPVLKEVMRAIASDQHPSPIFAQIQREISKICTINFTTPDDAFLGKPYFVFTDEVEDFAKLAQFLESQEESLVCIMGNQVLGHWFTLSLKRGRECTVMDSQDNFHSDLGMRAPSVQCLALLRETDPKELRKRAFQEAYKDEIQRKVEWIEDDCEGLLEQKDRMMRILRLAVFEKSDDLEEQIILSNVERLLQFYLENGERSLKGACCEIAKAKNANVVNDIFQSAIQEIESMKENLSRAAYERTYWTFKEMQTLYQKVDFIAELKAEESRLGAINSLSKIGGAENGFAVGKQGAEAKKALMQKVHTLLLAYQKAKKMGRLEELAAVIGRGDGCLTGRMSRVVEFYEKMQGFDYEESIKMEEVSFLPQTALSRAMEEIFDSESGEDSEEEIDQFLNSVSFENKKNQKILAKYLEIFGKAGKSQPFLEFLRSKDFLKNEPDWEALVSKIVQLEEFSTFLSLAKQSAKADLLA